jgi:hypothetical protein
MNLLLCLLLIFSATYRSAHLHHVQAEEIRKYALPDLEVRRVQMYSGLRCRI